MQSRKQFTMILCLVLTFMLISCSNTYNNLVPNDKQNIMEFSLSSEDHKTRSVSSEIKENYITVKVPKGTDITRLFPKVVLPKQATLFPLTLKYLQEAFPRTDVLDMALRINPAKKGLEHWFLSLYEENPDFSIPPLVFPINFFYPVTFAVIGGQGGVEIYTVKVIYDDGSEPDVGDLPDPNMDESKKILSFYVPDKQKGSSTITHDTIDFMLKAGTDLRAILPEITTEPESVAIPLTREYLFEASSKLGLDPLTFAQGYINSADKRAFIKGAIASSDTSNLSLAIDKIIDFTNPIQIVVLGTLSKSVRVYTVTASLDKDEAYLKRIVFTKVKNPALIKDYIGEVFQEQKEVSCTLYYPYEYGASGDEKVFNLILDSQYTGSNLTIEYNGKEYSLNDEVPFKPIKMGNELYYLGNARAKVHVDNGAVRKTYTLKLTFKEDPDTIRSITDFRFETFYNSKIKATSIANIVNRDDEGEIKAEVLYSGEKPNKLIPSFITGGGKVLVGGKEQISKSSKQDFSSPINYVCVSKDGNYERVYTIKVEFIKVESPEVVLKSFKFPLHLNKEISQDAVGIIDEAHSTVSVDVVYDGTEKPFELVSEFSATGAVSIEGITQSSGFSTQNYKYDVYLKVTALDDENVSKTYRVHVTFNYSTQNKCQLLRFYFEKEKNPTLKETVEGYISSSSYNVYAVVPKECDETHLVPSFEAEGVVKVGGVVQTSGVSNQDFTNIVEYVVVSENEQNSKTYKVKVQKQGDIIYLDPHARGKNNGSTWKDAFRKLEDAIEAANNASDENVEIWITKTDYLEWSFDGVRNLKLNKTISIRGGFLGTETNKDERKEWGNTYFRDVNFVRSKNTPIKWAFVFDRINFYGDVRLFDFNYDDEKLFKDNSITFDNCFFDISVVNIPIGTQCLIKNSKSSERPTLQIDSKLSQGYSGVELIIEDSNLNCKKFELDGTSPLIKLKVLNSKINSTFSNIVAKDIEFENVEIKGVDGIFSLGHAKKQSRFKNVKTDGRLIFTGFVYGKNNDGEYLFENCSINDIRFSHLSTQYTRLAKDIKFKNCNINKFIVGTGNEDDYSFPLVDSIIIEGLNAENNDKNDFMAFGAKNVKIRDSNFYGNILINVDLAGSYYPRDESQRDTFLEIKNSNVIKLVAGYMKIKKYSNGTPAYDERSHGLIVLGDSKFDDILIAGGDEISLKHLSIKNGIGLYNEQIGNSKIELNDVNVSDSNGGIIDCRAKNIFAHHIQGFKENLFYGKENVVLEKSSFGNYLDRLTLVGNNVRIKDVKIDKNIEVDKNIEALVNIVALENFEFDVDKTSKYTTALYYPKAY
ncbi:MAG: hypothetical protein ACTTJ3_08695, partial [Treponema sp.]